VIDRAWAVFMLFDKFGKPAMDTRAAGFWPLWATRFVCSGYLNLCSEWSGIISGFRAGDIAGPDL